MGDGRTRRALVVLLLDVRYYHMWAYPLYIIGIVVMIGVLIAGKEVNGAKSWIELGSLRIQPVEFVNLATALALARVMSNYSFSINRFGDLLRVGVIVGIPMLLTILQNDTGSGIVLGAFLFVLYREGLNKWLCIPILLIAALFIVSFLLAPMTLLGLTALSVEIITKRLALYLPAILPKIHVPRALVRIASRALHSISGTCLWAAA